MQRIIVAVSVALAVLSMARGTTLPRSELPDGCVVGWFEVVPNPSVDYGPYDVYYRVWNGTASSVTVTRVTDNGSDVWNGDLTVPSHEVRNVSSGHGDHAQAGSYNHTPVFYTSVGTISGPVYTFTVQPDGACGWLSVEPNPCQGGDPYDVYYQFYNGTVNSIAVTRLTDGGSEVWSGSLSVPGYTTTTVYTAHGGSASSGIYVHSPIVFETSAGSIQGPDYTFWVNNVPGVAEHTASLSAGGGIGLTCTPSIVGTATDIAFATKLSGRTKLEIVDVLGHSVRTVLDGIVAAGMHHVRWDRTGKDGQHLAAGVYICRLTTGDRSATARVTLTR